MSTIERTTAAPAWPAAIHGILRDNRIEHVAYVPDAGHAALIELCEHDPAMTGVRLTTEQEGVALLAGSWLGGKRGVLLMQSSGVGNCINALSLAKVGKFPLLMLVTMRGEWGEGMPWQLPMGQATRATLKAMGVIVYEVAVAADVAGVIEAACGMVFGSSAAVAVLISQRLIGAKKFA